jgi:hypothetical protein
VPDGDVLAPRGARDAQGLVLGRPVQSSMNGEMAALDKAKSLIEAR